jgi:hypothetical protein
LANLLTDDKRFKSCITLNWSVQYKPMYYIGRVITHHRERFSSSEVNQRNQRSYLTS